MPWNTRRNMLRTVGGLGGLGVGASVLSAPSAADSPSGTVVIEPQDTDGETLEITELRTNADAELQLEDPPTDNIYLQQDISAGTDEENMTVELDQPIDESTEIEAWLWTRGDRDMIAVDSAFISHEDDPDYMGITYVEPEPDSGFNYPYYIYNPPGNADGDVPLLVESNNTGTATDDFEQHRDRALHLLQHGDSNDISEELNVPLLVPVFPRPRTTPVDGMHYIHALDRETLGISGGDLERVDLQLLNMVEHAKEEILADSPYSFSDQIMLNGFSASGNFVDRFTFLHPEKVLSVTAGGLNGMALLPLEELDGQTLDFHVGIADIDEFIGTSVDLDAVNEVNQYLYMGADDSNDTIPYDDAWTEDELRQIALDVYGDDMITERFPRCQEAYQNAGITAQFAIYDDLGHSTRGITDDLVAFHRRSLAGEDVADFGETIVSEAAFDVSPENPESGDDVVFDASASQAGVSEIIAYTWEFGDGHTATGETVEHTFESEAVFDVTITVISDAGNRYEATKSIPVGTDEPTSSVDEADEPETDDSTSDEGESEEDSDTSDESNESDGGSETDDGSEHQDTPTADDTSEESVPGFGVGAAVASLGGTAYMLSKRMSKETE
ncbi:PKD domain-containing protein [Halorubrum sp. DTA98]|uniref:PKD domain-containing protein n=1 Tax=Halorubrum sp. DTA98 TaxID=3402163 RepID=UPI003AAAB4D5